MKFEIKEVRINKYELFLSLNDSKELYVSEYAWRFALIAVASRWIVVP